MMYSLRNVQKLYRGIGLHDVSFDVSQGDRLGIVGESGSGKTTLLNLLAKLTTPDRGHITFEGRDLSGLSQSTLRSFRRRVQMIFQDPKGSLDPKLPVMQIIREPLLSLGLSEGRSSDLKKIIDLLQRLGLDEKFLPRYPHQLSGGQRQRIALTRALISKPEVLLADEPVSALDTTSREQVIELLQHQIAEEQLTLILVSHDLTIVERLCEQVLVLKQGSIVEKGAVENVLQAPKNGYTKQLLDSRITIGQQAQYRS